MTQDGQKKIRVLLSHRYFPPGPQPYGHMLRHIAEVLAHNGFRVGLQAGVESQDIADAVAVDESLAEKKGVEVSRTRLKTERGSSAVTRIVNAVRYVAGLSARARKFRPDVMVAGSFPPVIPALTAGLSSALIGAKFVYHVQDIHPEITAPKLPRAIRLPYVIVLGLLDRINLRLASAIVTLSDDMKSVLVKRGAHPDKITIIDNYSLASVDDGAEVRPLTDVEQRALPKKAAIRIIFAGNMGAYQNLPTVAAFVEQATRAADVEFLFIGEGKAKASLEATLRLNPAVTFLPQMPFGVLRSFLAQSDMGLVSLDEQSWRYAYPSKIVTYLGAGLPLVCMVNRTSNYARMIEDEGLGLVFEAGDFNAALTGLKARGSDPLLIEAERVRVAAYFSNTFETGRLDGHWVALMRRLTGRAG